MTGRKTVHKTRRGYTLMEVVLVVGVLVVVAAISYPMTRSLFSSSRIEAAADMVRSHWANARSRALAERQPYRFAVKENSGQFRLAPDTTDFWPDSDNPAGTVDAADVEPLVVESSLPEQVFFSEVQVNGEAGVASQGWTTVATFLPDGTAQEDVEIRFATNGAKPAVLKLRAATGAATAALTSSPNAL